MVFLNLENGETIEIECHNVRWVVEEEDTDYYLNTLMLTDKKMIYTYETATQITKGRLFKRKATKKDLHMVELKLSDIREFSGEVAVKQDGSAGNGLLELHTSRGKEYFVFKNKPDKNISEWLEELNRLVPPAREAAAKAVSEAVGQPEIEALSEEEAGAEPAAEPLKSASQS